MTMAVKDLIGFLGLLVFGILTIVSNVRGEDGAIYIPKVNSFEFGNVTRLAKHASMEPVLHMEMDIRNENFVLYSSTSSMFTMDLNGNVIYQLTDVNDNNNINISSLISFAQLNRNSVLLVDIHEHCIKLLDRVQNTTENLIGTCGTKGHRDGLFGMALFNYPSSVVPHPKRSTFYLAENFYIRRIELHVINRVFTELRHEAHVILGLVIDFDNDLGYYSTPYRIHRKNMANSKLTIAELNEAKDVGDTDGPLKKTKFNSPNHLALLDPSTILLIDSRNSRLRVLNLNDHSSSSLCKGSTVIQDVYGHFSECHLPNASSIMPLPFSNKVLIGDQGAIVQLELHFTASERLGILGKYYVDKLRNWEMVITVWQLVYTIVPLLIILGVTSILWSKYMNPKPAQHDNKGIVPTVVEDIPRAQIEQQEQQQFVQPQLVADQE